MIRIIRDKDGEHWLRTPSGEVPYRLEGIKLYRKKTLTKATQMPIPFSVQTLEGTMEGKAGDWLMVGVNGEMYPCDAEIFIKTYEPMEESV